MRLTIDLSVIVRQFLGIKIPKFDLHLLPNNGESANGAEIVDIFGVRCISLRFKKYHLWFQNIEKVPRSHIKNRTSAEGQNWVILKHDKEAKTRCIPDKHTDKLHLYKPHGASIRRMPRHGKQLSGKRAADNLISLETDAYLMIDDRAHNKRSSRSIEMVKLQYRGAESRLARGIEGQVCNSVRGWATTSWRNELKMIFFLFYVCGKCTKKSPHHCWRGEA